MVNNTDRWDSVASSIEKTVDEAYKQFKDLEHEAIEARPEPTAWSVKEIVGHLVDSASNNLHRIVHLQISDGLVFPDYSQNNNAWVSIQEYREVPTYHNMALACVSLPATSTLIGRNILTCASHSHCQSRSKDRYILMLGL